VKGGAGAEGPPAPPAVLDAVRAARRICIATHSPMDGDGLGCGLALQRALEGLGKEVAFVTEANVPRAYSFLPGADRIRRLATDGPLPAFDLLLGLDAGEEERLGRVYAERPEGARVVNIDHHVSNPRYGDVAWVDPRAAATGEQVYRLLADLGALDATAAQALLVSLVTDTGRFQYSSTTARTLRIAAALVDAGASPDAIQLNLYGSRPLPVWRLRARAVEDVAFHENGRVALLVVPDGYGVDLGVDVEDLKDLVDIVVGVEGVVVGALVRGMPDGGAKVSLRSKDDRADVAELAGRHGGGGHVRAAGFSSGASPRETAEALLPGLLELAVAAGG